ncbi:fimbria major subunit [Prevotellamassilia timonensis]|uniref:fimbria major subunit n=1 Tax=Prevotellamassilia timonensis TaxID=1852370 RepID=UPI00307985ED
MKKIYLPLALATTLALGACSSDNVVDNGGSNPIDLSKGGFVKMSLNLPTDNNRGSRAELNDGLASEYGIKNAYLVLFEGGDDENKASIKGAYALSNSDFEAVGDNPNHVTLTKRIAFANDTKKPSESNKYIYALVVLNNNGLFTVDGNHTLKFDDTKVDAKAYKSTSNFINFSKALASTSPDGKTPFASDVATNGIFMTNAPLCTEPGGATDPGAIKTLADVTSNIYTTEAEAKSKPAAEIYVERAVAKVTVHSGNGTLEANKDKAASKISYKLYNWAVDNTNKKSYIVRQYDNNWNKLYSDKAADANKYRFVWSSPVNPNATETNKLYRTAFAQDPEYATTTANADNYNRIASNASMSTAFGNSTAFGDEHPQYCNENTFQVTAQNQDQTTRVVLGVQMSEPGKDTYGADLYTINGNKEVVYTEASLTERLKNILLQESDVKDWVAKHATDASFDITFDTDKAGETTITKATFKGKTTTPDATEEKLESFTTKLDKALPNIVRYKGGVAYYAVRIKHFGDSDTPWNVEGQDVKPGVNSLIYPNPSTGASDGWFLGRYGVVRNNWYDINVKKIQTLGDATIPAFTNDPDDVLENYISVSINVLSWSKHTQDADL